MPAPTNPMNIISKYRIAQGDRLFTPINDLLIILSAMAHAMSVIVGGTTHKKPKPQMRVNSRRMQYAFAIPLRGPLEHALEGTLPNAIEIGITPSENAKNPLEGMRYETKGMGNTFSHVMSPIYLIFFERYNDWLTAKYGDGINWPPTLNFARVIRNAVAHGKINIRNPSAPLVTGAD